MKKQVVRKYGIPDEVMLSRTEIAVLNVKKEHALFLEKFPWLTAEYLTGIEEEIKDLKKLKSDFTIITEKKLTERKSLMKEGRKNLKTLFGFAPLIYPDDKKKQRIFGQDRMAKARNNIPGMCSLLEYAHSVATKNPHKNKLLNRGFTEEEMDNLLTLSTNLSDKIKEHDLAGTERPVITSERITQLNSIFSHLWTISICAQAVFSRNPEKIKQYKIYP